MTRDEPSEQTRGDLERPEPLSPPAASRLPFYLIGIGLLLLFCVPVMAVGSGAIALRGGYCAYSACVHRREGWLAGAVFGIMLFLAGGVGVLAFLVMRLF
jgi:hypothetical protein